MIFLQFNEKWTTVQLKFYHSWNYVRDTVPENSHL